ncbi:MAG: hypothetical protein PHC86_03105 [Eubacteriales bacterium]|nr:hypothetical protein [Eubacteriales bacterium]
MKNSKVTFKQKITPVLVVINKNLRSFGAYIRAELNIVIAYIKKHGPFWIRQIRQDVKREGRQTVQAIKRVGQERVYRLKGYTTVAKINRKRQSERQQRFLRRILLILFGFLLIILLANVYNPIKDFSEWYRIIGVKHITDLQTTTTSIAETLGN